MREVDNKCDLREFSGLKHEEAEDVDGRIALTNFQKHGIWRAKKILERYGGVIIADGVGLGKTFTAGGLMDEYQDKRQRILLMN